MAGILRKLALQKRSILSTTVRLSQRNAWNRTCVTSKRTFIACIPRLDRISDAEEQIKIGSEHLNKGSLDMAMNSYHKSVQLAPSGTGYFNIGVCYFQMGKHHDAIKSFERSLEYTPNSPDAHTNIATSYLMLKDTENAIKHLEKASNFDPLDGEIQYNLACVYEAVGRLNDAKTRFERAEMQGIEKATEALEKLKKKL
ncbi:hypothetical protein BDF20DRAFT_901613 [Mycotypha africana]|uniref:uncharacterized protein n=1 Tax=Mycotypha africana TaxID=64632 RepID=UPI0022FFC70D|nr:uncharacterized protein BDF20DRAFT_901613 [Mycotypha africana]KAI8967286.1 hypothetical protein BDF20DRAFT_901613 [Mycotypha africana]